MLFRSGKAAEVQLQEDEEGATILAVGYDMSFGLLRIASGKGHEVVRGDCFDMSCWRGGVFVSPSVISWVSRKTAEDSLTGPRHLHCHDSPLCDPGTTSSVGSSAFILFAPLSSLIATM